MGDPVANWDPDGRIVWVVVAAAAIRVAAAVIAAAPAVQRIVTTAPRISPTIATQIQQLQHIISRHTWANAPEGASVFFRSIRWENLIQYGNHGTFESVLRWTNGNWSVVNTVRFNQNIGYEAIKLANGTYWYRVTDQITYVFKYGMLWTMYPGLPR
jgi:hypothetical protein